MNTLKKLAGVLIFLTVLGLSIVVTKFLHTPFNTAADVSRAMPSTPQVFAPPSASRLASYQVRLVSLDFEARQSYTTLTLKRDLTKPVPESLWVRAYFFMPGGSQAALSTDTVEFHHPFKDGNTVTLTATAPCRWCDQPLASSNGYYARVQISTQSANDVLLRDDLIDDDITTAAPVLVQNGRSRAAR